MFYERSFIEKLNQMTPIAELMSREGEQVLFRPNASTLPFLCSRCNGDMDNSKINVEKNFFKCFRCEGVLGVPFQGKPINYVQLKYGYSLAEAVEHLCHYHRIEPPKRSLDAKEKAKASLFAEAARFYERQLEQTDYFERRGVSTDVAKKYLAGFAPAEGDALFRHLVGKGFKREQLVEADLLKESGKDKLQNRIVVPLMKGNMPIGFYSRRVDEGAVLKHWVVGGQSAVIGTEYIREGVETLDLYESALNKLAAETAGLPAGVSIGGCTNFSVALLRLIGRLKPGRVRIVFDADRRGQGQRMALQVGEKIRALGIDVYVVLLPLGEDVSSLIASGQTTLFLDRMNEAMPYLQYRAHYLMSLMSMEDIKDHMEWRDSSCSCQAISPLSMLSSLSLP